MTRPSATTAPYGLVQVIRLHWNKPARGGEGARARNAVPSAFEVQADDLSNSPGNLCIEELHWGDKDFFAKPFHRESQRASLESGYRFGCVTVSAEADRLMVRYQYDWSNGGAPDRWYMNAAGTRVSKSRDLFVAPSEWVRVCYNGRFACRDTGNWWYEQITVNVARFDGEASGKVFLQSEPNRELKLLAQLR
jgi:hypothetical protein